MGNNRIIGYGMIIGGAGVALLGLVWGLGNIAEGTLRVTGLLLLMAILFVVAAILVVGGLYVLRTTAGEMAQMVEVKRQKKILNVLQTQGQLSIAEAALEVDAPVEQIRSDIYDLVGKGLFSGYIDWNDGVLYSRQARDMRAGGVCPNCGGQLELAGKGVIKCPYCGTEIFL